MSMNSPRHKTSEAVDAVVAGHAPRNLELCKLLESKGVDPSAERLIEIHFWAHGERAAEKLALALRDRGWSETRRNETKDPGIWNVEARIRSSVLAVIDLAFTAELARLAGRNHGEFDGWGTSV
jgi:regulator of RNase E activity RraB